MIRNLPQKDEGRHALHLLAAELDNHLPRRVGTGEPAHLPTCSRLVAGRPPHQGTPGIRTGTRKGLGLRCFADMRRRGAHAHRSLAEYQRLPAPTRSRRAEESERRSVPHNRQPLQPQEPTYPAMAGEASASEANLHPSGGVLAQPPRSVVATVQTRGLGRTELRRRAGDRVSYEGSYQATHTESGCILLNMSEKRSLEESESLRLEGLYRKASDPVLRTHLLMVWRMSVGDPLREVARMVGYSEKWTREIARRYEFEGVEGLGDRRHGNPGAKERALLDEEGQAELREALLEGSPPGGGMWSGPKVARWIEQKRGLEKVHAQRGWEYLRKVGHSPQVPRPSNAQGAESEEREAFKKSYPSG